MSAAAPAVKAKAKSKRVTFVERLFNLVSDAANSGIVEWRSDGRAFTVIDVVRMSSQVLKKYYRTDKFCSFVRQLSNYSFVLVSDGSKVDADPGSTADEPVYGPVTYRHDRDLFQRGRLDLLAQITRRQSVKRSIQPRAVEDNGDPGDEHVLDEEFDDALDDAAAPDLSPAAAAPPPPPPALERKPVKSSAALSRQLADANAVIAEQARKIIELEHLVARLRHELALTSAPHFGVAPDGMLLPPPPLDVERFTSLSATSSPDSPSGAFLFDSLTFGGDAKDTPFQSALF